MAEYKFSDLKAKYEGFREPKIRVYIGGNVLGKDTGLGIISAEVEQTSGFEASIATVVLGGAYKGDSHSFDIKKTKQFMYMGSTIIILMGYAESVREVFRGFIARVHFIIPGDGTHQVPSIELTCMDVKGLMMANRHSKRLKSQYYSDAVKEVLQANPFMSQKDSKGKDFIKLVISNTPDKPEGAGGGAGGAAGGMGGAGGAGGAGGQKETTDKRVEMVEESDYEFVVKAAKKYNFDFFAICESVYFIEAKKNADPVIELKPNMGLANIDVGYDLSGIVKSVEVRNIDMDQGKYIGGKKKSTTKISLGNVAKPLVEKQSMVYIDPTTDSKNEAGYRAAYLMDTIDYRLGNISAEFVGIPELTAGRFVTISSFGTPLDNNYYLTSVRHILDDGLYKTVFEGCTNTIGK
ncbi:MAG: hypothetical protein K6G03_11080 [Lachnospiraceae bacterium]|nr:hypothetical protein [Lachnospiraceae bacterium]